MIRKIKQEEQEYEKIRFKDLSFWLKAAVAYAIFEIFYLLFTIGTYLLYME